MKIALYIEEGLEQIVLTPQTETEKLLLSSLRSPQREMSVFEGQFYQGGGVMRRADAGYSHAENSTFIVLKPKQL